MSLRLPASPLLRLLVASVCACAIAAVARTADARVEREPRQRVERPRDRDGSDRSDAGERRGLPRRERVEVQLERTRVLLDRARGRLESCGEPRAHELLESAFEMQRRAESSASSGRTLAAFQRTMGARERALSAYRLCRFEGDAAPRGLDRELSRTDSAFERYRGEAGRASGRRARFRLERAAELQDRARAAAREGRLDLALQLTRAARALVTR